MKVFNICDYGAKFSDKLQTEAIQKAIDDCFLAGGGRVLVPCGIYMTGGIRLRSNVELYLEAGAILKGSRNPGDYYAWAYDTLEPVVLEEISTTDRKKGRSAVSTSRWCNALIRAFDAENISVIGEKGSYIDGNNCYDPQGENNYRGPHGMSLWRCKNLRFEGYHFINSSNWCHAIFQSQNITFKNVSVSAGFDSIDLRTCDNVMIEDCTFNSGDDCLAGFDNNDVTVRNCTMNTACMPIRFGGNNVLIENCVSDERRFGSRLRMALEDKILGNLSTPNVRHESHAPFSYYCDHRADLRKPAENIVIRNCRFDQAHELIRVEFDGLHRWCCNKPLRQITFENCFVSDLMDSGMIWSNEEEKITCHFKNVKIVCREGFEHVPIFVAGNFEKIIFENCTIEGYVDPHILVATDDKVEIINSTPLRVVKTTQEECIKAHPGGIASQDLGKNLKFI